MGIGTFGSFTQARLAIYAAQTGLNVTGNNISNINTPGYTRQRLKQVSLYAAGSDRYYAEGDIRTGQGALVKSLSQIRSPYLDIRYRTENAKVGYMDAYAEGLQEIATILDEVGRGDITKGEDGFGILGLYFNKIAEAMRNLVSETGHQEYDDSVRQVADNLVTTLNSYANKLEEVRKQNEDKLYDDVDDINGYLKSIRELNEEIRKCEIHGDPALELRDERNRQIDELSELIDINVTYSEEVISGGLTVEKLTISLDDANPDGKVTTDESLLVDGIFAAQLSFQSPKPNPYYGVDLTADPEKAAALNELLDEMVKANQIADLEDWTKLFNAFTSSPYLGEEKDAQGNVFREIPVDDIRNATILTGEENPNYSLMISELKNKLGELHTAVEAKAKVSVDVGDVPMNRLTFNSKTSYAIDEEKGQPSVGDKTVTVYSRTLGPNPHDPPVADDYTYTKQVFQHLVTKPVALDDNDINGKLQAHRELLTEEGEFTDLDVVANVDEGAQGKRGIPYYQKSLDMLANQFAKVMNEANQGFYRDNEGFYITEGTGAAAGTAVRVTIAGEAINNVWEENSANVQNAILGALGLTQQTMKDNKLSGTDVLNAYLKGQTSYDAAKKTFEPADWQSDANKANVKGIFTGGVLFSNNPGGDDPSKITAANISISSTWQKSHILVRSYTCAPGDLTPVSGKSDNLDHMEYLLDFQKYEYVPSSLDGLDNVSDKPMFEGTFFEMWNNIGNVRGHDQTYTETQLKTSYETALSIDTQRDAVSSVDFNDEAMNLMMYSKSYNAACRLMTTIDSVLDKLINNTGVTT